MYKTTTSSQPRPGLGRQLLGAGMGIASMGKNLGLWGGASGGQVQGGLSGLVQGHQNNQQPYYMVPEEVVSEDVSETVDVTDPSKSDTSQTGVMSILLRNANKRGEAIPAAKKLMKQLSEARKATYGPGWREREQKRIEGIPGTQAWTELGRLGLGIMGAEGHKDFLQALGEVATKQDTFGKFAEAQEKQRIEKKEFEKRDIQDIEAELKDTLGLAELESKEAALASGQLKNILAYLKATKGDLKGLEKFSKTLQGAFGALGSQQLLHGLQLFAQYTVEDKMGEEEAANKILKQFDKISPTVVTNTPTGGKGKASTALQQHKKALHTQ